MRALMVPSIALLMTLLLVRCKAAPLINEVGGTPPAAAADPSVDPVLQQLEEVGKNLKDFSAKLKLTETDNALGTETVRVGSVKFDKTANGGARVHVIFDMRIDPVAHKGFPNDKIEYLLDGPWLIDRNYVTRNEVKRQVLKKGQTLNLFKLGEGPFPLPIGQTPQDVHATFVVKKIAPAKDDPANSVHLSLTPRPDTDMARKFESLDVWVDEKSHMPVRVDTVEKQTTRSTELSNIVLNPPGGLPDSDFQLSNIDSQNWNRHVETLKE